MTTDAAATTYLLYAWTGRELEAHADLTALGIDAWCGRTLVWKRKGKARKAVPIEAPAIPNYLVAAMDARQFHQARGVRWLANMVATLTVAERREFAVFQRCVDAAYREARRQADNGERPAVEFMPGEEMDLLSPAFVGKVARFRRLVQAAHERHPRLEVEMDGLRMLVDPLDVRKARA